MDSESKCQEQGVDRISALLDELVCHILSFVPTMYAVWTTILSRRWINLWRFRSSFDFDDKKFPSKMTDHFMKYVGRVLAFRGSPDIQKLSLHIHHVENLSAGDFPRVHRWISTAIRHNIVELDLLLWFEYNKNVKLEISLSLFKCKTLEVLSLHSNCITYPAATTGCFQSLKVLNVYDHLPVYDSVQKFFAHLPVLEELRIDGRFGYYDVLNIKLSAPELKTLRISLEYWGNTYNLPNNIFIKAPKLKNLEVTYGALTNYILESTIRPERTKIVYKNRRPYIDHVNTQFGNIKEEEALIFTNRVAALLAKDQNVKYLSLDAPLCLKAWCIPALETMGKLELSLRDCYNWQLLTELLKMSPMLEYLGLEYEVIREGEWNPPEIVPIFLSSSLKPINVKGLKGWQHEMEVVKYLLHYGEVLNTITISTKNRFTTQYGCPYRTKEELCKELSACQKGSKICQVNII